MSNLFKPSKSASSQTSTVQLPAWMDDAMHQNTNAATAYRDSPFQAWTGPSTTGLTGAQDLGMGITAANGSFNPSQVGGPGAGYMTQAGDTVGMMGGIAGLDLRSQDLSGYQDPYTKNVIDSTFADIDHATLQQQQQAAGKASMAGAFGGDRAAIEDATIQSDATRTKATVGSQLRSQAFQRSQDLANGDINRKLGAVQTQNAASLQSQLGNQSTLTAYAGMDQRAQEDNQNAGISGAQIRGAAATNLFNQGEVGRQAQEAGRQFDYGEFLRALNDQPNKIQWSQGVASGAAPYFSTQQTNGYTPGPSPFGSMLGLVSAGAGIAGAASDRDDKTDIQKLGKDPETGQQLYSYRYKGDPKSYPKVVGPMAQDIEASDPGAVREDTEGHKMVSDMSQMGGAMQGYAGGIADSLPGFDGGGEVGSGGGDFGSNWAATMDAARRVDEEERRKKRSISGIASAAMDYLQGYEGGGEVDYRGAVEPGGDDAAYAAWLETAPPAVRAQMLQLHGPAAAPAPAPAPAAAPAPAPSGIAVPAAPAGPAPYVPTRENPTLPPSIVPGPATPVVPPRPLAIGEGPGPAFGGEGGFGQQTADAEAIEATRGRTGIAGAAEGEPRAAAQRDAAPAGIAPRQGPAEGTPEAAPQREGIAPAAAPAREPAPAPGRTVRNREEESGPGTGAFEDRLGWRESRNRYDIANPQGFTGRWQFGTARLESLGMYRPGEGEDLRTNQWRGQLNIPGFPQIRTQEDFRRSPEAQQAVMAADVARTDREIDRIPGSDAYDRDGLRAVAHLGGYTGLRRWIDSNGRYNPADANGTRLGDYYQLFAGSNGPPGGTMPRGAGPDRAAPAQAPAPSQQGIAVGTGPDPDAPRMERDGTPIPGGKQQAEKGSGPNFFTRIGRNLMNPEYAGSLALIQAGGAMAASRNPNWMGAIGEGITAGATSLRHSGEQLSKREERQEARADRTSQQQENREDRRLSREQTQEDRRARQAETERYHRQQEAVERERVATRAAEVAEREGRLQEARASREEAAVARRDAERARIEIARQEADRRSVEGQERERNRTRDDARAAEETRSRDDDRRERQVQSYTQRQIASRAAAEGTDPETWARRPINRQALDNDVAIYRAQNHPRSPEAVAWSDTIIGREASAFSSVPQGTTEAQFADALRRQGVPEDRRRELRAAYRVRLENSRDR